MLFITNINKKIQAEGITFVRVNKTKNHYEWI